MRVISCFRVVAHTAIVVTLTACSDDISTSPTQDPLVAEVIALGFRPDMIQDRGDYFLVEGDIRISKDALRTRIPALQPDFQWRTDTIVGQSQVQNIVADLSGLASVPDWQSAARAALFHWDSVNCSAVRLTEGSPGDVTFSTFSDENQRGLAAVASFPLDAPPGSGNPGPTIEVNTAYTGTPNDSLTKLRNMVHEIGHTIGFRHTNWQTNDCLFPPCEPGTYGANLISGTPETDDASVMNGGTATVAWSGFSTYDRVSTKNLYPATAPETCITAQFADGNGSYQSISSTGLYNWSASASGGDGTYSYQWTIDYEDMSDRGLGTGQTSDWLYVQSSDGNFFVRLAVRSAGKIGFADRFVCNMIDGFC